MQKKTLYTGIAVTLAIIVIAFFFYWHSSTPTATAPTTVQQTQGTTGAAAAPTPAEQQQIQAILQNATSQNSVTIQEVKIGTGATATAGHEVAVNYIGKLSDGSTFDASANHGGAFTFTLGAGQVIKGWDQGVAGMKVGGERILVIPPSLGYGAQQVGPIPANSTLIFDVQLVGVSTTTAAAQ